MPLPDNFNSRAFDNYWRDSGGDVRAEIKRMAQAAIGKFIEEFRAEYCKRFPDAEFDAGEIDVPYLLEMLEQATHDAVRQSEDADD